MASIRIDLTCPPVVLTVFNGKQASEEVDRYIDQMNAFYARGEPYIGVSFMLQYSPDPVQLRRIADWARDTKATVQTLCRGAAIVAPSPGFRFLLSSFLMLQPFPVAYRVSSDVEEAADWIEGRATPVPLGMRVYLREEMAREQMARERSA